MSLASSTAATPTSNGGGGQRRGGLRAAASSLDAKVDRALDKVDGFVGRLSGKAKDNVGSVAASFTPVATDGD